MAAPTKFEFSVKMTCQSCVDAVKEAVSHREGVKLTGIDMSTQQVLVETTLPSATVKEIIESTGRRAVLMGAGSTRPGGAAAVAMLSGGGGQGVVRFIQTDENTCVVEGTVDGLEPGAHRLAVHEYGDLSDGCRSCGDVLDFAVTASTLKGPQGDMGVIDASEAGRAQFRLLTSRLKVSDIIGRSLVIHDSGERPTENSRLQCGIVARSSGLFENPKRICLCDGVSVWDERDVPVAGPDRRQPPPPAQL